MMFQNFSKGYVLFIRRFSKVTEPYVNMEKLETVRLSLPGHPKFFLNFQYYDSSPNATVGNQQVPTIMATHGTPGSHYHFNRMVPRLLAYGYRVIIPNWPGFGITDNPPDDQFDHSNLQRAQLLTSFVKALNLHKIDVAVGHSVGCYPYPPFFCDNPGLCKASVLITPGEANPRVILRLWPTKFLASLLTTWFKPVISYLVYFVSTKVFDMRIDHHSHAAVLMRVVTSIDFTYLNAVLLTLKKKKQPPVVLVCTKEDHLVEIENSIDYAEKLGCLENNGLYHIENGDKIEEIIGKIFSPSSPQLNRHHAIFFERGDHFLQKHEAESICKLIKAIIDSNKN